MFCIRDQRDVAYCTCSDIKERVGGLKGWLVRPFVVVSRGSRDRPVFPTRIQPVLTPERGIEGMTMVKTQSGSTYVFESKEGKTFVRSYAPSGASRVPAFENVEVTISELPIEPGYPLRLRFANGQSLRSTPIAEVDYEYKSEDDA